MGQVGIYWGNGHMSDHLKPLPANSDQFRSIRIFQNYCQTQLDDKIRSEGRKQSVKIDPSKIMVVNRDFKDGQFELVYNDPGESFFCGAQISLNNHEMVARTGISETKTIRSEAQMEMSDTCSVAKHLVGNVEKGTQTCTDEAVSPKLLKDKIRDSASIQKFEKYCREKLNEQAIRRKWGEPVIPFSLDRVQIINLSNTDPYYTLRYSSPGQNFICEATVDPRIHSMLLRSSEFDNHEKLLASQTGTNFPMTDACSLTTLLIGKDKLLSKCHDKSDGERTREKWSQIGFHALVTGMALYSLYKTGKKFLPKIKTRFLPGLRIAGNALLAGWIFDKTTGLFLSEDNPLRKYGYYGALTTGAIAPYLWKRVATSAVGEALGTRILTSRILGPALGRLGGARLGARFLAVMAFDMAVDWLLVDGDYEASINKRVQSKVFKKDVYTLDGWDLLVVPLAIKGLRAGTHFLAPNASEWAVAKDNPKLVAKIKAEDLEKSRKGKKMLREVLPRLLASTSFYDPTDPESYQSINLSSLESKIELNKGENLIRQLLQKKSPQEVQKFFGLGDEDFEKSYQRILLKNIQDTAGFITFVEQDENNWARYIFNKDGTLKPGQATSLVYELFKDDNSGMPAVQQIYEARKIQVIAAYLNQETTFGGKDIETVAQAAGIFDDTGAIIVDGAFLTALSYYASDAIHRNDSGRLKNLEDLCKQLKWRYLQAGPYSREPIGDALRVLGVDPDYALNEKDPQGQMCFSKDSFPFGKDPTSTKDSQQLTWYQKPSP